MSVDLEPKLKIALGIDEHPELIIVDGQLLIYPVSMSWRR